MPIRPILASAAVMVLAVGLLSSGCSSSNPVDQNINTDVAAGWVPEAGTKPDTAADVSINKDTPDGGVDSADFVDASSADGAGIDGVTPEGG